MKMMTLILALLISGCISPERRAMEKTMKALELLQTVLATVTIVVPEAAPSLTPTMAPTPRPTEQSFAKATSPRLSVKAAFMKYVKGQTGNKVAERWAGQVADMAGKWCKRFHLRGQREILATLWVESGLDPAAPGADGEQGMGQATPYSIHKYGKRLRAMGLHGDIKDPSWQVGLCVAEMKDKAAKFGMRKALEYYNGKGKRARAHRDRVRKVLLDAFGK